MLHLVVVGGGGGGGGGGGDGGGTGGGDVLFAVQDIGVLGFVVVHGGVDGSSGRSDGQFSSFFHLITAASHQEERAKEENSPGR
eukprot:NODE_5034_length_536_cov_38.285421_g3706_i0.p4 GENE.NODE_5034_length_536_cov_38.285421_g3706_i0~~NODE_5034_length_536_cov_38.285421_g3706_i0.p4  ORF type:complete len:84 (-),score=27.17 NODE_5034_length_536_cov_38.285421_g3706_i0:198-449(-)